MRRLSPLFGLCAASSLAAWASLAPSTRAEEPASRADSPWIGTWLWHSPDHGSYQATEFRFRADGSVTLTASVDTNAHGAEEPHQLIRSVVFGRRSCRLGDRWAPTTSRHRVDIRVRCNDGRERTLQFGLRERAFDRDPPGGEPFDLRVDGRRGYRVGHNFPTEFVRCSTDPTSPCDRMGRARDQRRYTPAEFDAEGRWVPPSRRSSTPDGRD